MRSLNRVDLSCKVDLSYWPLKRTIVLELCINQMCVFLRYFEISLLRMHAIISFKRTINNYVFYLVFKILLLMSWTDAKFSFPPKKYKIKIAIKSKEPFENMLLLICVNDCNILLLKYS